MMSLKQVLSIREKAQIKGLFKLNAITQNIFWGDDNKIINPNKSVKCRIVWKNI